MDPRIYVDSMAPGRRRRQAFEPIVCSELNYTDAQRAFCENDEACLCDLVAAEDQSMATTSLESGKNFSAHVTVLSKKNCGCTTIVLVQGHCATCHGFCLHHFVLYR